MYIYVCTLIRKCVHTHTHTHIHTHTHTHTHADMHNNQISAFLYVKRVTGYTLLDYFWHKLKIILSGSRVFKEFILMYT